MAQFVKLVPENLKALREVNPRLMSYNVEFAEEPRNSMSLRAQTALLQCTRI